MRTFNTDTERIVISGLMKNPDMADRILAMFTVDDFYLEIHRDIFRTAQQMRLEKRGVDIYTLHPRLQDKYKWTEFSFIEEAGFLYFPESMLESYRDAIKEERRLRETYEIVTMAHEAMERTNEGCPLNISDFLADLQRKIHAVSLSGMREADDAASQLAKYNEALCESSEGDRIHCLQWPLMNNDILWQKKTLNAVAARPGGGKSSFLIHLFTMLAEQRNYGMYFSVEVKHKSFFDRMASCTTKIPKWRFRDRQATAEERGEAVSHISEFTDRIKIRFKENTISPDLIASDLYRFQQEKSKLDFFIVDYLQILDLSAFKFKKRYETLRDAAEYLRDLADRLNCVCLIGVQVGREYEKQQQHNETRLIRLADFRESGDIENTVDTAIGLNIVEETQDQDKVTVKVIKNREGVSGAMFGFHHDKVRNFWDEKQKLN